MGDDAVAVARHFQGVVQEADRIARHLPPERIRWTEERSDPNAEIETLVGGGLMYMSKAARRQLVDALDWLVDVARERVTESGEQPALSVVRVSVP